MLKLAVLFVRRSSLVSRRSRAENFISCEIRFTRDASRDTVFALADFSNILLVLRCAAGSGIGRWGSVGGSTFPHQRRELGELVHPLV